jgi:hypothetical protein
MCRQISLSKEEDKGAGLVACIGEMRNVYKSLVRKLEG